MVDPSQVPLIQGTLLEFDLIGRAIELLDQGGKIIGMTVSLEGEGVGVSTDYISYPPQMKDAIISAFVARRQELQNQLTEMGVTGLEGRRFQPPFGPPQQTS